MKKLFSMAIHMGIWVAIAFVSFQMGKTEGALNVSLEYPWPPDHFSEDYGQTYLPYREDLGFRPTANQDWEADRIENDLRQIHYEAMRHPDGRWARVLNYWLDNWTEWQRDYKQPKQ